MNTLASPSGPARRPGGSDGLRPPAPTQAAVPSQFASLTWPADVEAAALPAPDVAGTPQGRWSAPARPRWAAPTAPSNPTERPEHPAASSGPGWNWTPIMDDAGSAAPSLRSPSGDLAIELTALEAVFESRTTDVADETEPAEVATGLSPTPTSQRSDADRAMPSVSFDAAAGSVTTSVTEADTAVVTATVPAFVTYAPSAGYVLPVATAREPIAAVEVRETIVNLPRPARPRRTGRLGLVIVLGAAAISAAAYLGFREYIYGDAVVADDGTRVVEVEPTRTIVVVDAP